MARRRGVVVVVAMQECPSCGWMEMEMEMVCVCVSEGVCVWVTYLVLRYL